MGVFGWVGGWVGERNSTERKGKGVTKGGGWVMEVLVRPPNSANH